MTQRNFVVRAMLQNPNRNAGKHSAKQTALSTATRKEMDIEIANRANEMQHVKDLEDFDPINDQPSQTQPE